MAILRALGLTVALAALSTPAWAAGQDLDKLKPGGGGSPSARAPEIDPAGLGAAAALLVGGGFLLKGLRSRRRRTDQT